jgi:hypothetical protein
LNDRDTGAEAAVTSQNFIHSSKLGDSSRSLGGNHHVPAVRAVTNSALNAASVFPSRRIEISFVCCSALSASKFGG